MNHPYYQVTVIEPPVQEPVTLAEVKAELRAIDEDDTSQDARLNRMIRAARELAESFTRRAFCQQTLRLTLDCFPGVIELPRPPLIEVQSITYYDTANAPQTLLPGEWIEDAEQDPGLIAPLFGESWPATLTRPGAIKIDYLAGYAPGSGSPTDYAANVPAAIKEALLGMIYQWYWACPDGGAQPMEMAPAFSAMLQPYRCLRW